MNKIGWQEKNDKIKVKIILIMVIGFIKIMEWNEWIMWVRWKGKMDIILNVMKWNEIQLSKHFKSNFEYGDNVIFASYVCIMDVETKK